MAENDKRRFEELLPWHVNGTLSAGDRAWVEQYLGAHPEQRSLVAWHESLQQRVREAAPPFDPERGLDRLMQRVRAERPIAPRRNAAGGFAMRVHEWLAQFQLRPAFAGMALLVVGQAVVIGMLVEKKRDLESEYAVERSLPSSAGAAAGLMKVSFKPDARENDIRLLLVRIGGTMAGGPGQLGEWVIKVPAERLPNAEARLRDSGLVDAVEIEPPASAK